MNMKSNRTVVVLLLAAITLLLVTGCAKSEFVEPCLTGHQYGFFGGLWHGFIAPFDFIGMLFNNNITMYAQNNNGGFYALGFLIGSGGWGFLGGKGVRRKVYRYNYRQSDKFDHVEVVE
jgi:hypothetical protein